MLEIVLLCVEDVALSIGGLDGTLAESALKPLTDRSVRMMFVTVLAVSIR